MASSLLALLDDITSIMDDVATLSKVAIKKTTGVLSDDLALNAEAMIGSAAEREIPIILKVAKGSFINKAILVPLALLISYFIPWLIAPLLMIGGAYLCYEGVEKIYEKLFHKKKELGEVAKEILESEEDKIKGAVKTDFILSAEIIVIALGTVAGASIGQQLLALTMISIVMTIGVYGFVAIIIKLDDFGLFISKKENKILQLIGRTLLGFAPLLLKALGFIGTIAMFLVGGGIITHGIHLNKYFSFDSILQYVVDPVVGVLVGTLCLTVHHIFKKSNNAYKLKK